MATLNQRGSNEAKKDQRKFNTVETPANHNVEDVSIIWFDQNMDEVANKEDVEKTKTFLRKINDYVLFFSEPERCIEHIKASAKEKIFLITSGSYALEHLDKIHPMAQIDSVFIFCVFIDKYLPLKEKYSKLIDVFTEQSDLIESLTSQVELVTKQAAVFGLFDGKERSTRYLTRESGSFLWFQLLTDVLKTMSMTDVKNEGIEEMLTHCRLYYRNNRVELNSIDEFRRNYKPHDAIVWYSKQSFVYRLVNKALRTEDIEVLYTFRVFIAHLRTQIADEHEQLRKTLRNTKSNSIIHLYRGLKMTNGEILQMRDNVGGLISMNGFFSTSRDAEQANRYATKKSQRSEVVGVLLEIDGDVTLDKMVFADIARYSAYPEEKEVLFDLATIFKIVHVEFDKGRNLWVMQLSGVGKNSYKVNDYIKSVAKETEEKNSTLLLGRLMCDMGEYVKAEKYLKRLLLSLPKNHNEVPKINFYLGRVCNFHGDYKQALEYYEHALVLQKREIEPKTNSFDIAQTLHNIGEIHFVQQETERSLEYFEQALEMKRLVLTKNSDHPSIATTLTLIGSVYKRQGDLVRALELFQQAYEMKKLALPADHPSIADSLNHLGIVYQEMDDTQQALECFRNSLAIKQKTLPPSHLSISATLNNMGIVHRRQGEYDKALVCYTKTLEIEQTTLSSDSLDLADTYYNLYLVFYDLMQYERAVEMLRLRLLILKKHFSEDSKQVQETKSFMAEMNDEIKTPVNSLQKKESIRQEYL